MCKQKIWLIPYVCVCVHFTTDGNLQLSTKRLAAGNVKFEEKKFTHSCWLAESIVFIRWIYRASRLHWNKRIVFQYVSTSVVHILYFSHYSFNIYFVYSNLETPFNRYLVYSNLETHFNMYSVYSNLETQIIYLFDSWSIAE